MNYIYPFEKEFFHFFKLDKDKLEDIEDVMKQHITNTITNHSFQYAVEREDNSKYVATSLEELLTDKNMPSKKITDLTIIFRAKDENNNFECKVSFHEGANWIKPIKYSVTDHNKGRILSFSDDLDKHLKRSFIKRPKFLLGVFNILEVSLPIIIFCLFFLGAKLLFPNFNPNINSIGIIDFLMGLPIIGLFFYGIWSSINLLNITDKLKNNICNSCTFYWGDQKEIFDNKKRFQSNIKWVVIVGGIVSLMMGLVSTWITN